MILNDVLDLFIEGSYKIMNRLGESLLVNSKETIKKHFGWLKLDSTESIFFENNMVVFIVDDSRIEYFLHNFDDFFKTTRNV